MNDWSVIIHEDGRSGKVIYRDRSGSLPFYWEFGGGDVVATIQVGDAATWQRQHGWAAERRAEILRRVGDEVIRQKAPNCRAEIDDRQGWIYIRSAGNESPLLSSLPATPSPVRNSTLPFGNKRRNI